MSDEPDRLGTLTTEHTEFAANGKVAVLADAGIDEPRGIGLDGRPLGADDAADNTPTAAVDEAPGRYFWRLYAHLRESAMQHAPQLCKRLLLRSARTPAARPAV